MAGTAAGERATQPDRALSPGRRRECCGSSSSSWSRSSPWPDVAGRPGCALVGRLPAARSPTTAVSFLRSFRYALGRDARRPSRSVIPLAYVMAFRSGRFKNLLLGLVILPFFTTFLVRTFAWKTILNDGGPVGLAASRLHLLARGRALLNTTWAVVGGLTYNFLPFMILPDLRQPREDRPPADRGGAGSVLQALGRVRQGGASAVAARGLRRQPADVHPGLRRLHQRRAAGQPQPADDRHRDPEPVSPGA